jgi:hypothetical protein
LFEGDLEPEDAFGVGDVEFALDVFAGGDGVLAVESEAETAGF